MRIGRKLLLPGMFVMALLIAAPAAAQGIGIGVKGGPVFTTLDFSGDVVEGLETENRTGWMGGLFIGGNRPGLVGVGVEINYIKRRVRDTESGLVSSVSSIDVPVYLRLNGGSRSLDGVNFYGIVGPAFEINLAADEDGEDIKDSIEDFDLNLVIGGGVEITRFIVEVRYMKGLRNIAKDLSEFDASAKSNSFAVLFGVRFN